MRWQVRNSSMLGKRDNASARAMIVVHESQREGFVGHLGARGPLISAPEFRLGPVHQSTSWPPMTSEVFNANPTIVATAAPTARRRAAQARHSLWLLDDEDSDIYDSDDGTEPIDADEIFGLFLFSFRCSRPKAEPLLKTLFVPSATQSTAL